MAEPAALLTAASASTAAPSPAAPSRFAEHRAASSAESKVRSSVKEVAAYAPFLLWKRAAHDVPLTSSEVHPLTAAVMFADISGFTKLTEELAQAGAGGAADGGGLSAGLVTGAPPLADGADTLTP